MYSDERKFTVDPVVIKQNVCIVRFENVIFEVFHVLTTKHPAAVMMLDIVESNEEKSLQSSFKQGSRLTFRIGQIDFFPGRKLYVAHGKPGFI